MLSHLRLLSPLLQPPPSPTSNSTAATAPPLPGTGEGVTADAWIDSKARFLQVVGWLLGLDAEAVFASTPVPDAGAAAVDGAAVGGSTVSGSAVGGSAVGGAAVSGSALLIRGLCDCLRTPGRDGAALRTSAARLVPAALSGLAGAYGSCWAASQHQPAGGPTPSTLPPALGAPAAPAAAAAVGERLGRLLALQSQLTDAVQWLVDECWPSDPSRLPRSGPDAAALRRQMAALLDAATLLCRKRQAGWQPAFVDDGGGGHGGSGGGHGGGGGGGGGVRQAQASPGPGGSGARGGGGGGDGSGGGGGEGSRWRAAEVALQALFDALLPVFQQLGTESAESGENLSHYTESGAPWVKVGAGCFVRGLNLTLGSTFHTLHTLQAAATCSRLSCRRGSWCLFTGP